MKKFGYSLITAGFLVAALIAVIDTKTVNWMHFIPALAVGIVGVIMVRVYEHAHRTSEDKITGHLTDIETSIASIANKISSLSAASDSMDTYHLRNEIDELFTADIIKFVDARQAITQVYGLQEYADAMSYFASAERAINRAWSASTDGYKNEVNASLQKANEYFAIVNEKIINLKVKTNC
ncbi:MAG: hypothetical protein JRE40_14100 [Deltaproteobacteria bacterium]|nr:hypothetical protein [Deltaproteobacteria bacterium]